MSQEELDHERKHVREAWDVAQDLVRRAVGLTFGANHHSAHAVRRARLDSITEIEAALRTDQPFAFGRIDVTDDVWDEGPIYIGRCHVGSHMSSWRAPVAEKFYLSTHGRPERGVLRKRTFSGTGPRIETFHDLIFGSLDHLPAPAPVESEESIERRRQRPPAPPEAPDLVGARTPQPPHRTDEEDSVRPPDGPPAPVAQTGPEGLVPTSTSGPGGDPLLEELGAASSSEMRDIVRTIQGEQYRLMTASLDQHLIIQGGPGTGKTAVGLHRLALQIFRHRDRLPPSSVLVVGPTEAFVRYVASVLPSLGEDGVTHVALPRFGPTPRRDLGRDRTEVRRVKGSARMAEVLARFLASRVTPPTADVEFEPGLALPLDAALAEFERARGLATYNDGRTALRDGWMAAISRVAGIAPYDVPRHLGDAFERAVDRTWPSLSAQEAVHTLLSGRILLNQAAQDLLAPEDITLLLRPRAKRLEEVAWTIDDVALLDEVEARLSGPPRMNFGHVLVDEAQDVTPMQWRMLARRARGASFTILGDLAQRTSGATSGDWDQLLASTGISDAAVETLTTGYRAQDNIIHWANRLLWTMDVDVLHARSVRRDGPSPLIVPAPRGQTASVAVERATSFDLDRRVGVIGPSEVLAAVAASCEARGISCSHVGRDSGHGIILAGPGEVSGLEFDDLVVVEPAAIVAESEGGTSTLYVALTRTRGELTIVHADPLPPVLRPDRLDDPAVAPPRRSPED